MAYRTKVVKEVKVVTKCSAKWCCKRVWINQLSLEGHPAKVEGAKQIKRLRPAGEGSDNPEPKQK